MANKKVLYAIIAVLVLAIIGGGAFFFFGNQGTQEEAASGEQTGNPPLNGEKDGEMVNCGQADDPMCFINRMNGCLPVTTKMVGSDGKTSIEITILGVEDEKCHFERKLNGVLDMNCFFPKGTLNMDTFDQMFGNDRGLQQVVDDACESGW